MKGKRHTTGEKIRILREVDGGRPIREVCQERNLSEATYHRWRKQAVLRALTKYGALVADNGNFFSIFVTPDDRWPDV